MSPLRLHAKLLVIYVLIGLAVTAVDGPLMRGSFINLSGALSLAYWALAGFVAVVSSLALPFARGREGVVVGAHIVAGALALPAFIALNVHDHNQGLKAAEEQASRVAAQASTCSRLESWSWEERPRGTVHLFLNVTLGAASGNKTLGVIHTGHLGEPTEPPLPSGPAGQHVAVEVVIPRTDPAPFGELTFYIPCPFAGLFYSPTATEESSNSSYVTRPLPPPFRGGEAPGVLQGYDLIVRTYKGASRFLLRPSSNAAIPRFEDAPWRSVDALESTLDGLLPHQTIDLWTFWGDWKLEDTRLTEAAVVRRGHRLVKH